MVSVVPEIPEIALSMFEQLFRVPKNLWRDTRSTHHAHSGLSFSHVVSRCQYLKISLKLLHTA